MVDSGSLQSPAPQAPPIPADVCIIVGVFVALWPLFVMMAIYFCYALAANFYHCLTPSADDERRGGGGAVVDVELGNGDGLELRLRALEMSVEGTLRRGRMKAVVYGAGGDGVKGGGEKGMKEECVICMEEFKVDELCWVLPHCGHGFHSTCADRWFHQKPNCPVCRGPI